MSTRLTKIEVVNLFGIFKHTIPLNLTDRITIIHGPNGYGKTVLLSLASHKGQNASMFPSFSEEN